MPEPIFQYDSPGYLVDKDFIDKLALPYRSFDLSGPVTDDGIVLPVPGMNKDDLAPAGSVLTMRKMEISFSLEDRVFAGKVWNHDHLEDVPFADQWIARPSNKEQIRVGSQEYRFAIGCYPSDKFDSIRDVGIMIPDPIAANDGLAVVHPTGNFTLCPDMDDAIRSYIMFGISEYAAQIRKPIRPVWNLDRVLIIPTT